MRHVVVVGMLAGVVGGGCVGAAPDDTEARGAAAPLPSASAWVTTGPQSDETAPWTGSATETTDGPAEGTTSASGATPTWAPTIEAETTEQDSTAPPAATTEPVRTDTPTAPDEPTGEPSGAPTEATETGDDTSAVDTTDEASTEDTPSQDETTEEPEPEPIPLTLENFKAVMQELDAGGTHQGGRRVRIISTVHQEPCIEDKRWDCLDGVPQFDPPLFEMPQECGPSKVVIRLPAGVCAMFSGHAKSVVHVVPQDSCESPVTAPACSFAHPRDSWTHPDGVVNHTGFYLVEVYPYTDCDPDIFGSMSWSLILQVENERSTPLSDGSTWVQDACPRWDQW